MATALILLSSCQMSEHETPGLKSVQIFVSEKGSDSNPGSADRPFATLEKARGHVRELRRNGSLAETAAIVNAAGRFELKASLKFTKEDSGTAALPLIFRSLQNDKAVLSGGKKITNFKPITDPETVARLKPNARDKVLQSNLTELGITDFGKLSSRGFTRKISPAHMELFFDNRPMTLARYPNEGAYLKITGYGKTVSDEWKAETGELS